MVLLHNTVMKYMGTFAIAFCVMGSLAHAQNASSSPSVSKPAKAAKSTASSPFASNSKDPIKIDADRLDVFDKEKRAVFTGNVVAVQGETTMRCTVMTVFYEQSAAKGAAPTIPSGGEGGGAVKKIDCVGPVTVVQKDQVATGNNAVFDKVNNMVTITGNAVISQGQNVTRGEKLVYNLNTGMANVEGGRVRALFVPGNDNPANTGTAKPKKPKSE
jgi:lipopolysaccharide export system protein LptA